jgi:hypothetical protein
MHHMRGGDFTAIEANMPSTMSRVEGEAETANEDSTPTMTKFPTNGKGMPGMSVVVACLLPARASLILLFFWSRTLARFCSTSETMKRHV